MDRDQFIKASKGEGIQEKIGNDKVMYLELQLPYRRIKTENHVFLLLPGFEKFGGKNRNHYWQDLLEFSVKCSNASVFVCNESSLANLENEDYRSKMEKQFGNNMIYAITHADTSRDGNAGAKKTLMTHMGISDSEEDRIVCVGAYDSPEKNQEWCDKFEIAIEAHFIDSEETSSVCSDYISDIITEDIEPLIDDISDKLASKNIAVTSEELELSKCMDVFEGQRRKKRKALDKVLSKKLGEAESESDRRLMDLFKIKSAKKAGFKNPALSRLARVFFGESLGTRKEAEKRIRESLHEENAKVYGYQIAVLEAFQELQGDVSELGKPLETDVNDSRKISARHSEGEVGSHLGEEQGQMIHDVACLLANGLDERLERKDLQSGRIPKVIEFAADLSAYYFAGSVLEQSVEENGMLKQYVNMPLDMEQRSLDWGSIEKTYNKGMKSVDKVLLGILGVAGFDKLDDGTINLVPKLAEALGLTAAAASAIVGGVMAAVGAVAVARDINRMQIEEYRDGQRVIASIHREVKDSWLSEFDDAMDRVEDRVRDRLNDILGIDRESSKIFKAKAALEGIRKSLDEIVKEEGAKQYAIASDF